MNKGISKMMKIILMKIKKIFIRLVKFIIRCIYCNNKTESMKLQIYKNIDVVQINIKAGVKEYFFPQNVDWADKKIDKLVVYGSEFISPKHVSPIDGITPLASDELLSKSYFNLYDTNGVQISYNMSAHNIKYTCNHPIELNSILSLQMSKIVFPEAPDVDCCMLIYVFWGTSVVETDDIPNHNITIEFPIGEGEEVSLASVIDTYIHSQSKKVKGIYVWSGSKRTKFLTLRDYNYRTIVKLLPGDMCRPPMGVPSDDESESVLIRSQLVQVNPMYLDCADVDFENSTVFNSLYKVNPTRQDYITITFLY